MAYEFKKLSDVEVLDEVPENANALVEVDGAIKRVPGSGLGGNNNNDEIDFEFTMTTMYTPTADEISVTGGSIDNVLQRIRNGEVPKVRVIIRETVPGDPLT